MKIVLFALSVLISAISTASAAGLSREPLPKQFFYWGTELWIGEVGKADTPVRAFLTWQMCYEWRRQDLCDAVGITQQQFEQPAEKWEPVAPESVPAQQVWLLSERVLDAADVALLGGERSWAKIGYAEVIYYVLYCDDEFHDEDCDREPSELPVWRYGRWAYFKPVGASWSLAGWSEPQYRSFCMSEDSSSAYYKRDCDLAFSPFDEGFRRLIECRHWPWGQKSGNPPRQSSPDD